MEADMSNFILIPGYIGAHIYFDTTQRHFYNCNPKVTFDIKKTFRCTDSHFVLFADPARKKSEEMTKCLKPPDKVHNHELLSQEMLELAVIRWDCVMTMFAHRARQTNLEIIESVLSSWPHQLSFTSEDLESKFSRFLNFYRKKAPNKEFVENFLAEHDEDQLAHFRQVILQFRTAPVRPGSFYLIFLSTRQILIDFYCYSYPTNGGEFSFASTESPQETSYGRLEHGGR